MTTRVLVTGGAGFIGAHMVKRLLEDGQQVVMVDNFNSFYAPRLKRDRVNQLIGREWQRRGRLTIYRQDLANFSGLQRIWRKHRPQRVCHLAAQAGVRYYFSRPQAFLDYRHSNLDGTLNLLELAKAHRVAHFVMASTSSVYGAATTFPFREDQDTSHPLSLYAATKKADEVLAYSYSQMAKLPVTVLRFFNVYGPWGRPDGAYYKWADLISAGKPIDVYGFGKQQRDWTYVADIVEGVVRVLAKPQQYGIYNIGRGRSEQLMEFLRYIELYLGKKAKQRLLPLQPGEVRKTFCDTAKLKRDFGYQPKVTIAEGVKHFIDWYQDYQTV